MTSGDDLERALNSIRDSLGNSRSDCGEPELETVSACIAAKDAEIEEWRELSDYSLNAIDAHRKRIAELVSELAAVKAERDIYKARSLDYENQLVELKQRIEGAPRVTKSRKFVEGKEG